jgi:hypothetical protein
VSQGPMQNMHVLTGISWPGWPPLCISNNAFRYSSEFSNHFPLRCITTPQFTHHAPTKLITKRVRTIHAEHVPITASSVDRRKCGLTPKHEFDPHYLEILKGRDDHVWSPVFKVLPDFEDLPNPE